MGEGGGDITGLGTDFKQPSPLKIKWYDKIAKNKIGPLTKDLVVLCKLHELQEGGNEVPYERIVEGLKGIMEENHVSSMLELLSSQSMVYSHRFHPIEGEVETSYWIFEGDRDKVRTIYDENWQDVLQAAGMT